MELAGLWVGAARPCGSGESRSTNIREDEVDRAAHQVEAIDGHISASMSATAIIKSSGFVGEAFKP